MKALKAAGVEDNTLVIMTSDNGPWISYGNHARKTPFLGVHEGAVYDRRPSHARPPGRSQPPEKSDRWHERLGPHFGKAGAVNPHEYYAFSTGPVFEGVIRGDGHWKLHLPHEYRTLIQAGNDGMAGKYRQAAIPLSLFDMEKDALETTNLIDKFPDVAAKLKAYAEEHKKSFYS